MATVHLNKEEFLKKVANYVDNPSSWEFLGDKPAVVDFYAEWCGPCRQLSPRLEALSDEYAGKVDIYKINVDEEEELAQVFGVQTIPTLFFIPTNGNPQRAQGALPQNTLKEAIESLLK